MIKTNLYPLRSIVGQSIRILKILDISKNEGDKSKILHEIHSQRSDVENNIVYSKFLPTIIKVIEEDNVLQKVTFKPATGTDSLPPHNSNRLLSEFRGGMRENVRPFTNPPDNPFPGSDNVASLFCYNDKVSVKKTLTQALAPNKEAVYNFLILLEKEELVGGICFNGYPYISARIEDSDKGMTIGNFGLPREIRLTPLQSVIIDEGYESDFGLNDLVYNELKGFHRSQFIDSEFSYTRQENLSHSGINYLTIDPVKTNLFLLTVTDVPFITSRIDLDKDYIEGFYGFAIPYLYFFKYHEHTKKNARLHAGLLGVKKKTIVPTRNDDLWESFTNIFSEFEYFIFLDYTLRQVSGKVRNMDGTPIAGVEVKVKGTNNTFFTDNQGNYLIQDLKSQDTLVFSRTGYITRHISVRARTEINLKLKEFLEGGPNEMRDRTGLTGEYFVFTAHSCLGQYRTPYLEGIGEYFISDQLQRGENVILYLQQAEEFDRNIAGLKCLIGSKSNSDQLNSLMPGFGTLCESITLKVYELDPSEGISPTNIKLDSKYATLLADMHNLTANLGWQEMLFNQYLKAVPFRRTSAAKYFAIELTNTGKKAGVIPIYSLEFIRSAHVSVQPRPAKNQQIKALHYRIIGPELGDDFSRLGNEGFNFSIDRMVAGQTKGVLYSANSLLDLLHTGNARIHNNVRRRAIEFEMIENFKEPKDPGDEGREEKYSVKKFPNDAFYMHNYDYRMSAGWRKSETGKNVEWDHREFPKDGISFSESHPRSGTFRSFGSAESRTHSISLFPDISNEDWATVSALGNMLTLLKDPGQGAAFIFEAFNRGDLNGVRALIESLSAQPLIDFYRHSSGPDFIQEQLVKDFTDYWFGIDNWSQLRVTGLVNSTQSPSGVSALAGDILFEFIKSIESLPATLQSVHGLLNDLEDVMGGGITMSDLPTRLGQISAKWGDLFKTFARFLDLPIQLTALLGLPPGTVSPFLLTPLLNGLSLGITTGVGININSAPNVIFPSFQMTANSGSTGNINKTASNTGYSYSQYLNSGLENTEYGNSEVKRIVSRRELLNRDEERVRGAEVMWQGKIQDIITGSIPLNFTLNATATKMNVRTADDALRVRFNSGFSPSIEVDFWFELTEETLKDDN